MFVELIPCLSCVVSRSDRAKRRWFPLWSTPVAGVVSRRPKHQYSISECLSHPYILPLSLSFSHPSGLSTLKALLNGGKPHLLRKQNGIAGICSRFQSMSNLSGKVSWISFPGSMTAKSQAYNWKDSGTQRVLSPCSHFEFEKQRILKTSQNFTGSRGVGFWKWSSLSILMFHPQRLSVWQAQVSVTRSQVSLSFLQILELSWHLFFISHFLGWGT